MGLLDRLFGGRQGAASVRVLPADLSFDVPPKQTILQAALDQGIAYPHSCRVGSCGTCKTRLVEGEVRELTDKSYLLTDEEMRAGVILACQSVPKGPVALENDRLSLGGPRHDVVVARASIAALDRMTSDIMRLSVTLDAPLAYTAGQYAELARPGDEMRQFSFIDPPSGPAATTARFFIRHVPGGAFTSWLFEAARPGDTLDLRGPFGDFWLRPGTAPIVAIAGGSGLGPVKAVLEQARADRVPRDVILVFGVRTRADLYALDEISLLTRSWISRFIFVPVLSAEPADSDWSGARGFVHEYLASLGVALAGHQAYLCGPPVMIDAALPVLRAAGIAAADIHYDAFTDRSTGAIAAA